MWFECDMKEIERKDVTIQQTIVRRDSQRIQQVLTGMLEFVFCCVALQSGKAWRETMWAPDGLRTREGSRPRCDASERK